MSRYRPFRSALRVGRTLLAYIHRQLLVEGHFLGKARSHLWGLVHLHQRFVRCYHGRKKAPTIKGRGK